MRASPVSISRISACAESVVSTVAVNDGAVLYVLYRTDARGEPIYILNGAC